MTVTCVDDSRLVSSVREVAPDLVILDVHTPAMRGNPSWKTLGIKCAPATIVTAYDPSAVSAFASSAIDCLVKPFNAERFEAALELAKSAIARARMEPKVERSSYDEGNRVHSLQRLAVEVNENIVLVKIVDIRWIQSSGNYVRLHLGETSHLFRQSMKNLQVRLDSNRFLRVHRNAIVNLDHVEEFHLPLNGNMFVKLNDGLCLPIRKGNRAMLRRLLKNIS